MRVAAGRTIVSSMRKLLLAIGVSVFLFELTFGTAQAGEVLARLDGIEAGADCPLFVCARLQDATGLGYALVRTTEAELLDSGLNARILAKVEPGSLYYLARSRRAVDRRTLSGPFKVLYDDGRTLLLTMDSAEAVDLLAGMGFELRILPDAPPVLTRPSSTMLRRSVKRAVTNHVLVAEMISRVNQTNLYSMVSELSSERQAVAEGCYSNIPTRYNQSGLPLRRASDYAYRYLQALGLDVSYQGWSLHGYSGRNIVAVRSGTTLSSEVVVVCAHLDDMPSGVFAPGADDNASGSAGVMAVAAAMRRYSFDRTVRYVLFTGEEQGLLGSGVYAAGAQAAGDNLVGVFNLDMISWDSNQDGVLWLHTRTTSDPSYSADLELAAIFTNVVSAYGLTNLTPTIHATGDLYSDHASFWDHGFAAVLAIEDDNDFTPYYHTTSDRVDTLNMPYFTSFVKAATAAAAHLAQPGERVLFDAVEVVNGTFESNSTVGVGRWVAMHRPDALEGPDPYDLPCGSTTNPYSALLGLWSAPYETPLQLDARPDNSETLFHGRLTVTNADGTLTCTNRLRITFPCGFETNGLYTARITITSTDQTTNFLCITNLRNVTDGFVNLPLLTDVSNETIYGTCEISRRWLQTDAVDAGLYITETTATNMAISVFCQLGAVVEDRLDVATRLFSETDWTSVLTITNTPPFNAACFEQGGQWFSFPVNPLAWSNCASFIRLNRQWIEP